MAWSAEHGLNRFEEYLHYIHRNTILYETSPSLEYMLARYGVSLELLEPHDPLLPAGLLCGKHEQVRVQHLVRRHAQPRLILVGHRLDKGAREAQVASAVHTAGSFGRIVLAGAGEKVEYGLRDQIRCHMGRTPGRREEE